MGVARGGSETGSDSTSSSAKGTNLPLGTTVAVVGAPGRVDPWLAPTRGALTEGVYLAGAPPGTVAPGSEYKRLKIAIAMIINTSNDKNLMAS